MTTRRDFLRISGMGIVVLYTMDIRELMARRTFQFRDYPKDFNAYLRIGEDGRVTFFTGKIEMGQGVYTSLPQMLAEELDVPLSSVDPILGDTDLCPWDMGTFGSMSTRFFGPPMRQAAAEAKAVLKDLAAERLGVPRDRLGTRDGVVYDVADPAVSVTYAELARGQRIERVVRGEVSTDEPTGYTVSGVATARLDGRAKVTGQARYAADMRLEGMLSARILRPPAHGAKLRDADTTRAAEVEGVRIVREGDLVAVLHRHPDVAQEALGMVTATWDRPAGGPDSSNIFEYLEGNVPEARVVSEAGSLSAGRAASAVVRESTFRANYMAHAPMEPHAALASVDGQGATIWASTQNPFTLRREAAEILGCPEEDVRVITPFVGGGFGGKTENDQAHEAVRLSRAVGAPVQVAWTREEEFFHDSFRPATIVHVASGVDHAGRLVFWDYRNLHGGNRSSDPVYAIPHHRVTSAGGWGGDGPRYHPLRVGAWRGPGANVNHFAIESQVDIMAETAGKDPLSFRMEHAKDERVRGVLQAAADLFGEEWRAGPSGRGYGVASGADAGTMVAAMAEVDVDRANGVVRVLRMVCAQDMGEVINPEGARMQMEGGLIQGLGYALREEIHFDRGAIVERNFDRYALPRFSWLPSLEVTIVDNRALGPQGGGEPSVTMVGAVLANAIHDAIGKRMYELPMTPERVLAALA